MEKESKYQSIVNECNKICQNCILDFQKEGIPFNSSMCKFCKNGAILHNALRFASDTEQKWDKINWGSSKWEDLYKG